MTKPVIETSNWAGTLNAQLPNSLTICYHREALLEAVVYSIVAAALDRHCFKANENDPPSSQPEHAMDLEGIRVRSGLQSSASPFAATRWGERTYQRRDINPKREAGEAFDDIVATLEFAGCTYREAVVVTDRLLDIIDEFRVDSESRHKEVADRLKKATKQPAGATSLAGKTQAKLSGWLTLVKEAAEFDQKVESPVTPPQLSVKDRIEREMANLKREAEYLAELSRQIEELANEADSIQPHVLEGAAKAQERVDQVEQVYRYETAASGILALNGTRLTQAVIARLGGMDDLRRLVEDAFALRHNGQGFYTATAGGFSSDTYAVLAATAREVIAPRLAGFTVVDAVVALDQNNPGHWRAGFKESLRKFILPNRFSDPEWENVYSFDRTVLWCFPPVTSAQVQRQFHEVLRDAEQTVQFKGERELTPEDPETMVVFVAYFGVSFECTRFYQGGKDDYDFVTNNLEFHPYPELHPGRAWVVPPTPGSKENQEQDSKPETQLSEVVVMDEL